jgi:hypothetical protein
MPIFGSKDKEGNLACNFMHTDGLVDFPPFWAVCITQNDNNNRLEIAKRIPKNSPPVYLPYDQIISIGTVTEKEIIEKSKSVVGRAAVGGLLLGPLGAVIGGMSGTGKKNKASTKAFFVINYHPAQNPEETKVLSFEIVGASLHWSSFVAALKGKIPPSIQEEQSTSQYL